MKKVIRNIKKTILRNARRAIACSLLASAVALGLLVVYPPSVLALYLDNTYPEETWNRSIPVCFDRGSVVQQPNFAQLRAVVMEAVARSWTQATGLRFTGWGQCTEPRTPRTINIARNTGCSNGGATTTLENRIDMNICADSWDHVHFIHEFGHALGFAHEFRRPDFPRAGCSFESIIEGGDYLHTIPDPSSTLDATYCNNNPELSYFDISGAQNLWGRSNFFADVNGDGRADAIVVNPNGVWVRITDPNGHMLATRNWTGGGFWGWKGTHFADVNGDGKADLIAVDDAGIAVRVSNDRASTLLHSGQPALFGDSLAHTSPMWMGTAEPMLSL